MKVLMAEPAGFSRVARAELERIATVRHPAGDDRAALLASLVDADVLWVRLRHAIDREVLNAAPRLCAIVSPTTGLDHIDLAEAARRGIVVLSLQGEVGFLREVRATIEHTLALALSLLRRIPAASAHAAREPWDRDRFKGRELYGKTAGIVGYGRVGQAVARILAAFGVRVLAHDPAVPEGADGVELVPLEALLARSDLVFLHVSLSESTHHLIDGARIAAMKPGAWLINTSRGELVDEAALLDALRTGHLAGAALDVIQGERSGRLADHPLVAWAREHDNLILTPHLGGCTVESMEKTELFLVRKLSAYAGAEGLLAGAGAGPRGERESPWA